MKRFGLAMLVALLALLLLFGWQQIRSHRQAGGTQATLPVPARQLRLYHYFSGPLSGGMDEMLATVNRLNPRGRVLAQALDHEAFKTMIHQTLARENPPEMFSYWAGAKTQALVDQDLLAPIDDIWPAIALTDRFTSPVTQMASTYNHRKYLLPITVHAVVFFYNKELLAREGLIAPRSWAELLGLADTLHRRGVTPFALGARERWPAQFWFDYLLLRTAGPDYRQDLMDNRARYTDREVHRVYAMWGSLIAKGYFNGDANRLDWAEAAELVCRGEAAMTLMGTWAIPFFTAERCGLAEESGFDFFAFPGIEDRIPQVVLGPVDGLVLTKGADDLDLAKTVFRYFAEEEAQQRFSQGSGAFAPAKLSSGEHYSPLRQRLLKVIENSASWAFNYDLATSADIAELGMDSFNELIAFPDRVAEILTDLQAEIDRNAASQ